MKFLALFFVCFGMLSCQSSLKSPIKNGQGNDLSEEQKKEDPLIEMSPEQKSVYQIEKNLLLENHKVVEKLKSEFQIANPNSIYTSYVNLLYNKSLLQQNKFHEALELNQKIQQESFKSNPKIYYEAVFLSADIYEIQGVMDKSLAALVEVESNRIYLSERIRFFELPLKLAIAYSRLNQQELSLKYIVSAENGLGEFLKTSIQSKRQLSELYFELGTGASNLAYKDYYTDAKRFSLTHKYLVYCLNLNETPFSEKAKEKLIYQIDNLQSQINLNSEGYDDKLEMEIKRFNKLTDFSKILNSMQLLEPLEGQKRNPNQFDFFKYLDQVQAKTYDEIYAKYKLTPPTEESFRHRVFRDNIILEPVEK